MFWICAENSIDNTGMFQLSLSSLYTESRPFLLLTSPHQRVGWGCTRSWEGTQLGQLTQLTKWILHNIQHHAQHTKQGEEEGRGGTFRVMALVFRCYMMEPCFPGEGWTPACWWEVVNEFLILLCLHVQLLLYLLNCLFLKSWVFSLLPFWFSRPTHQGRSEWLCVA